VPRGEHPPRITLEGPKAPPNALRVEGYWSVGIQLQKGFLDALFILVELTIDRDEIPSQQEAL